MKSIGVLIIQVTVYYVQAETSSKIHKPSTKPAQKLTKGQPKSNNEVDADSNNILDLDGEFAGPINPEILNHLKKMYYEGKRPRKDYPYALPAADNTKNKRKHQLNSFILHLKKKGIAVLEFLAKYAKKELNTTKDVTDLVKKAGSDYVIQFQNYSDYVSLQKMALIKESTIDEEFLFFDAIVSCNGILQPIAKKLVKDIIGNDNSKVPDQYLINRKFILDLIRHKKEEFKYIRRNYNIDRTYPSFIDYCAKLIREIIEMSNSKFEKAIKVIENCLKTKRSFLQSVMKKNHIEYVKQKLHTSADNLPNIRRFLSALRAAIIKRYKIIEGGSAMQNKKIKTVRILFDIFDKAFERDLNGLFIIDYDNTLTGVRVWVEGRRDDIEEILGGFLRNIIVRLDHMFSKTIRVEIKTLVQVILEGDTDNAEVYDDLNKMGSIFVRDEWTLL